MKLPLFRLAANSVSANSEVKKDLNAESKLEVPTLLDPSTTEHTDKLKISGAMGSPTEQDVSFRSARAAALCPYWLRRYADDDDTKKLKA